MLSKNTGKILIAIVSTSISLGILAGCSASEVASGVLKSMTKSTPSPSEQVIAQDDTVKYNLYVVNCNQSISLRSEPSTSASEIMQVVLGVQVGFISDVGNGFYKISVNGTVGYALAEYLSGAPVSVSDSVQYYMYVVNCDSSINLRSAPDASSSSLAQIPYGASVGVIKDLGNGFHKVKYSGIIGYASSNYLSASEAKPQSASVTDAEMFVDNSLRAFVNGINTGDTTYISRYFTGDAAEEERRTHDKIVGNVLSEEIISLDCHSGTLISSSLVTVVRDSVIRVLYDDGNVKDLKESYVYTIQLSDSGSMKITNLQER